MGKLATAVMVLAALVGTGVGLVLSSLMEVQCPRAFGNCVEVHRLDTAESAGIALLAAVAIAVGAEALSRVLRRLNGLTDRS